MTLPAILNPERFRDHPLDVPVAGVFETPGSDTNLPNTVDLVDRPIRARCRSGW